MSKEWKELAKFNLCKEDVENVFTFTGEVISLRESYAATIVNAIIKEIRGRFTASVNKKSFVFRFVKQCSSSSGCKKKWKICCTNESLLKCNNEFTISTNDVECNHTQPIMSRPLSGKFFIMF